MNNCLTKTSIDVIKRALILWVAENFGRATLLNNVSWLVLSSSKERRVVGDTNCLLHIVRNDHDRDVF
jgi:hypothetical protein